MRTVWIMGDKLHEDHPGLAAADPRQDRVLLVESRKRSEQQRYHQLKLVLIFSAMRHRAAALRQAGWQVDYLEMEESYVSGLEKHLRQHRPASILVQDPSQYDLLHGLPSLSRRLGVKIEVLPENQFLCARDEFAEWAADK